MKLIVGLLTLLCVARLAHCAPPNDDPSTIGARESAFLSFSDGFKDGTQVTIFYHHKVNTESAYISFYGEQDIDTTKSLEILAHITIQPSLPKDYVTMNTFKDPKWGPSPIACCDKKPEGTGPNKDWWRIDVYKFDDTNLKVFVQGSQTKEFKFNSISNIKSVYVFGSVDTNDVYIKYRIPSALIKPTPLGKFKAMVERTMKETPGNAPLAKRNTPTVPTPFDNKESESTSVNTVKISKFVKNAKIFITAWMGSKEENQKDMKKPRIQFRQAGNLGRNKQGVFTIYHEWDTKTLRKSYIDVVYWESGVGDKCFKDLSAPSEAIKCEPVKCVDDGSASDLEHYRIERTGEKEIEVTTYYAGANPSKGEMGTSCKTTTTLIGKLRPDLDAANFEIHGLNGAMILHADMQ